MFCFHKNFINSSSSSSESLLYVQDVSMDVLQFRDHVMTYEECAERLKHDLRLAKWLGFERVRVLSVVPLEVLAPLYT